MISALVVIAGILVYAWILYPGFMMLLSRTKPAPRSHLPASDEEEDLPFVSVIFSAHNEEKVIGARLANLSALNYPRDQLRIYAGIDGSTDRTEKIAQDWALIDSRIQVFSRTPCQGKTAMLKTLVGMIGQQIPDIRLPALDLRPQTSPPLRAPNASIVDSARAKICGLRSEARGPMSNITLYVFTDANTMFEPDALRRLVKPFSDTRVGGVCGRLVLEGKEEGIRRQKSELGIPQPKAVGTDEPFYWDIETRLKMSESRLDSCLGANGAIYAIRSRLFPATMPDNTIIDDFVIGMKVREQGSRMVFEPLAVAYEDLPNSILLEWRRRVRIGAGAFQALSLCRACLSPRYGVFSWAFWSHKVLRWMTPHLGILALVLGGWLVGTRAWTLQCPFRSLVSSLVLFFFACNLALYNFSERWAKVLDVVFYFLAMQAALFAGFFRYCRGNLSGAWERTERG